MLHLLFPPAFDNTYRGQWAGFWLLAPVLFLKLGIALAALIAPERAHQADAIDLSTYSAAALQEANLTMALLGLVHLCIAVMGVLAMVRYRAMVPLIHLWLLAEFIGRRGVLALYPIDRVDGPSSGATVNLILLSIMVLGFVLSVWPRRAGATS
jgi:hypothetical protein